MPGTVYFMVCKLTSISLEHKRMLNYFKMNRFRFLPVFLFKIVSVEPYDTYQRPR